MLQGIALSTLATKLDIALLVLWPCPLLFHNWWVGVVDLGMSHWLEDIVEGAWLVSQGLLGHPQPKSVQQCSGPEGIVIR